MKSSKLARQRHRERITDQMMRFAFGWLMLGCIAAIVVGGVTLEVVGGTCAGLFANGLVWVVRLILVNWR